MRNTASLVVLDQNNGDEHEIEEHSNFLLLEMKNLKPKGLKSKE